MKERLKNKYFWNHFDGRRHNWVPLKKLARCQYCYFILCNEIPSPHQLHFEQDLKQNRN